MPALGIGNLVPSLRDAVQGGQVSSAPREPIGYFAPYGGKMALWSCDCYTMGRHRASPTEDLSSQTAKWVGDLVGVSRILAEAKLLSLKKTFARRKMFLISALIALMKSCRF